MATDTDLQLTVYRGAPPKNAYVWSPFVTKLEARLRFSSVPYRLGGGSPRSAPKGKIPYVSLTDADGEPRTMGDSTLIIRRLVETDTLPDVNAALAPAQRAHDLAIRALMEDRAYFYGAREKWCDNYDEMRAHVLASVPWPLQTVLGWLARRAVFRGLYQQGTGRLAEDEVHLFKEEVWDSLNALLTESVKTSSRQKSKTNDDDVPFWVLGGSEPTEADASVYGFIVGALVCTAAPTTAKIVRSYPTMIDYAERVHRRYFPDYERWM
ncbi:glutathione S-transferase [Metarhizium rileyi]|uniref:Glutathione S-transferase n=1 Tax=Metarhizium rileyi (strain RCEF 4871) TaxID=1649241 RepID=A0A162M780_METRR|nr:glutathione S-transferase [Metarhizium rileyi RCEF 4871]